MSRVAEQLTASERAIDSYLEELLWEPAEAPAPGEVDAAAYATFVVSGLRVAVPAARIAADLPLAPLRAGSAVPAWLRWMPSDHGDLPLVDVALLVLPDDLAPRGIPLEARCDRVLSLDGGAWCLALQGPVTELRIEPDPVCWRGPRGRRPWLAGALAESRCVLLDLTNIRQLCGVDGK